MHCQDLQRAALTYINTRPNISDYDVYLLRAKQREVELLTRKLLQFTLGQASPIPESVALTSLDVCEVNGFAPALTAFKRHKYQVGLLLLNHPTDAEMIKLDEWLETNQSTQWVGVFPAESIKLPLCRRLIVKHLFDFHTWPIDPHRLNHTLGHAYGYADLKGPLETSGVNAGEMALIGQSEAIQHLRRKIQKVASSNAPVLIWGESGSGKELTARTIHNYSSYSAGPFVALNCGAIPASLIQSELFGHERGAFTGATNLKRGLIESAAGGTLFLDEIGDLPLDLQANLLRFLQEQTINRVGSTQSIKLDVRVIAASNICLEEAVKAKQFREDLLYRLNVLPLTVPALRERKEDLEILANHFFNMYLGGNSGGLKGFSSRAMMAIKAHDWPGNVREVINRIRRAIVMADGRLITPEDLDLKNPTTPLNGDAGGALENSRMSAERTAIHTSLQQRDNNITNAARDLGVSRMTLYRLMEKHSILH